MSKDAHSSFGELPNQFDATKIFNEAVGTATKLKQQSNRKFDCADINDIILPGTLDQSMNHQMEHSMRQMMRQNNESPEEFPLSQAMPVRAIVNANGTKSLSDNEFKEIH